MADIYNTIGALRKRPRTQAFQTEQTDAGPIQPWAQPTTPMTLKDAASNFGLSGDTSAAIRQWHISTQGQEPLENFLATARAASPDAATQNLRSKILSEQPKILQAWNRFTGKNQQNNQGITQMSLEDFSIKPVGSTAIVDALRKTRR
jgi:hypothetical protein